MTNYEKDQHRLICARLVVSPSRDEPGDTAYEAVDEILERLAAAQVRNECPECGLTPKAVSTCFCEECVGELQERLATAEAALTELKTSIHEWKVVLVSPTEDDPFRKLDCEIIDIGYSDHAIVVTAKGGCDE